MSEPELVTEGPEWVWPPLGCPPAAEVSRGNSSLWALGVAHSKPWWHSGPPGHVPWEPAPRGGVFQARAAWEHRVGSPARSLSTQVGSSGRCCGTRRVPVSRELLQPGRTAWGPAGASTSRPLCCLPRGGWGADLALEGHVVNLGVQQHGAGAERHRLVGDGPGGPAVNPQDLLLTGHDQLLLEAAEARGERAVGTQARHRPPTPSPGPPVPGPYPFDAVLEPQLPSHCLLLLEQLLQGLRQRGRGRNLQGQGRSVQQDQPPSPLE